MLWAKVVFFYNGFKKKKKVGSEERLAVPSD